MRKILKSMAAATAAIALLAGCSGGNSANNASNAEDSKSAAAEFPVTIEHNSGSTEIDKAPESIVVFDAEVLDTLDALGVGDKVTGVGQKMVPNYLKDKYGSLPDVGSPFEPDMEAVAKLNPDLVILGARASKLYQDLSAKYPTVDATVKWDKPDYAKRAAESVAMIGKAVGKAEEGEAAAKKIDDKVAEYKDLAKDKGSALVVMTNGKEISLHGEQSRWSPIFEVFGFTAAHKQEADEGHKGEKVSFETIQELDPDWIFVVDRDAAVGKGDDGVNAKEVLDNDLVKATKAAKENHIVYLDSQRWYIIMVGANNFPTLLDEIADAVK